MKNILYRLLLLPLLLVAWGARAQAPAWLSATAVPANVTGMQVQAVATNAAGDIFVTGAYTGSVTFGSTTLTSKTGANSSQDAYVAKWSTANSAWAWAVSAGGDDLDTGYAIAVNGTSVYVTGQFGGNSAAFNGAALTSAGAGDVFVAQLIDGGTNVSNGGAVSAGGTSTDRGLGIAFSGNNVYVTGFINGAATISGTTSTGAGSQDIFVAKYVDGGTTLTNGGALRAGSTSAERGNAIAVNGSNIYVGAYFNGASATFGNNNASPFGTTTLTNANTASSSSDVAIIKYTDTGSLSFSSVVQAGGSDNERPTGIAVSGTNVYVTGYYASPSLTIAGTTLANAGGFSGGSAQLTQNIFVAKYTDGGTLTGAGAKRAYGTGGGDEAGNAIAVNGNTVYITGFYSSPTTFDEGATTVSLSGDSDIFVAKYTDAGGLTLNGALGGGSNSAAGNPEGGNGIAATSSQAIVGGYITATQGTFGAATVNSSGGGFFASVGVAPTTVTSIVPVGTSPTNAASVQFTVTFAASVTGLTTANFTTANGTGVTGSSVTSVSGSGTTYTVTVNTGSGSGTLGLTLANDTGLTPGVSNEPFTGTPLYTIDKTAPTVVITSSTGASGSTSSAATFAYTVTFSESVTGFVGGDVTVGNGTLSGFSGSGTTYTFNVTPTANGAVTVNVPANVAQDAVGNGNTAASQYSITYAAPNTTVVSVTRLTPSPTATTQVRYSVVFAASVTGVTVSNFTVTTTGSVSGASVSSASGSGTTYTVTVNTGTGDGTLRLNVANSTGISPTVTNVPYTTGETYTITKSFAAAPTLRIQGAGSNSGNGDVTTFVDVVQVLQSGTSTAVANALQNNSFETNNVAANSFLYQSQGVVASPWTFGPQAGVSRNNSAFGSTAADGDAVALLQSTGGSNGSVSQNLAVPTGSYQVSFRAIQRNYTSLDQRLNVFVNDVFVGNIQPNNIPTYDTFTSAAFSVTAPVLTATISSTAGASGSTTATSPLPFTVTFSQSVTGFTASDVTVTNGTISGFSGSGTTYTFNVTPSANGTVTVNVPANGAIDANNTGNSAATPYSLIYAQPVTAAPVVIVPANGSLVTTTTPTYGGNAPASSTITVFVDGTSIGTTTANGAGNWAIAQPTSLAQGSHTVYATAQTSGAAVSANSNTNTFTVDTVRPTVAISSSAGASGGSTPTSPIPYTVTFSEAVTGFVAGDVTVTNGTISGFSGSGATYTFNVTPSAVGTVTVNIPANVAQDQAGNGNTAATQYSLTFVAPTITVGPASLPIGTQGTAYSQALSASGGTAPYTYAITSGALPAGLSLTGSSISGTPTANGTFTFTVTATDNSAAPGPYSGSRSYSLTINTQPVTAAPVVIVPSNGSLNATTTPTYAGTAPANSIITVYVDGTALANTVTANSAGNWAISQPTALAQGSHTVYATAQTSGSAVSANSNTNTFTVDSVRPTVAISSSAGASGSNTGTSPIPFTVTFSEAVTGFVAGDVTVTNGTISDFAGSGTTYSFNVTPTTAGTATTVAIAANVAQDQAGNGNTAATQYSITYVQLVTATPTVTAPANGSLLSTTTPTYQGTAVTGSTVTVYVDGSAIGTTTATGGNFSLAQPTALAQGSHTVYATAQTSGSAVSANSTTNTFTIDSMRPTVAISSSAGASGGSTPTSPIPFTVTFSESVTGFSASGITVTNGTIGAVTGSGTTYSFSVTPTTVNTATTVAVAANAAQDQAGNGNTASSTFSLTYTVTLTSWTGTVSTDWYTSGNWTAGVPTATIDATIRAGVPNNPLITAGTATVRSLTVNSGATLNQTGGTLNITGNLTNNNTLALTGGTVALGTTTTANILGSGNTRFWNLTIGASGAQSSTSASTSVQRVATLNGPFATQGNPFTLESNSNSTAMLVNNGSNVVSGNVTVQRYITPDLNPNLGYRHFSSAIGTATVASLTTGSFSPVVNPAYNTSATPATVRPFPTVYGYDQSRLATATNNLPTFDKGWFSPNALSSSLTVGQGYTVNLVANQTLSLTGPQNNGDVPLTLSRNSDATAADAGLALVGNPYPSPLNWQQVDATDRPGLDGVIYVFTSNDPSNPYAGSYSFYNNNIGNISPVLPLGQGFFVRVSQGQTSATLTLKNSHRPTTYASTTYRRTAAETRPLVQLSLKATGSTVSDDAFVYFEKGATDDFDSQFDAIKLPNTNGLNISTSITGKQLSIDGRDELGKVQRVIPLAVGVPAAGTYTFTTAQLLNLDTTPVYLRDVQLGTLTDLRLTPSYQFTVTNASALITNRFELVFSPQQALATVSAALAQQVALYPNPAKTAAFLELPASLGRQAVTATLLDALGREVRSVVLPAQGAVAHQLDLHELATGVYALRLSTSAGVVMKRLTVE